MPRARSAWSTAVESRTSASTSWRAKPRRAKGTGRLLPAPAADPVGALCRGRRQRNSRPIGPRSRSSVQRFSARALLDDYPLEKLLPFIDWSPFFLSWELKGKYPQIFDDPTVGAEARSLFADAQRMLDRIVGERLLKAQAVYGFWRADAIGDDIALYADETGQRRTRPRCTPCGSNGNAKARPRFLPWPTSSPPWTAGGPTTWAPSP